MAITAIGQAALVSREAIRTKAYVDSVGVLTIGVGHTSAAGPPKVTKGLTITRAEALEIFARDLVQYEAAVDKAVNRPMADHERDAFVSICYNIGPGVFGRSTFVKRFNAGDKAGCAKAIMSWVKPPEITSRREAERDQFLTPYSIALPKARSSDANRVAAPSTVRPPPRSQAEAPAMTAYVIKALQQQLLDLGYKMVAKADGVVGPRTVAGVSAFQAANNLPVTGAFDPATIAKLDNNPRAMPIPKERAEASAKDVAPSSPIVAEANTAIKGGIGAAIGIPTITAVSEFLGPLREIRDFAASLPAIVWALVAASGIALAVWYFWSIREKRLGMHRLGETG